MNSLSKLGLVLFALVVVACSPAKSPLEDGAQQSTFAIVPDRVSATADFDRADAASLNQPRSQVLHFDVCLQNMISGHAVVFDTPFRIADGLGAGKDLKTDISGCLHWDETHGLPVITPQANLVVRRQIEGRGNVKGTVALQLNIRPWLDGKDAVEIVLANQKVVGAIAGGQQLAFGADYPVIKSTGTSSQEEGGNASQILLANDEIMFSFSNIGPTTEHELDRYLNLTIPYHYLVSFMPLVTRKLVSGQTVSAAMSAGRLRLTFVFFAGGSGLRQDDNHYLTSAQVEGEVKANGTFTAPMLLLKYPHLLMAAGRQTMLVQITPLDSNTGVGKRSFSGALDFVQFKGAIKLTPDPRDAEAIHLARTRERQEMNSARPAPLAAFLKQHPEINLNPDILPAIAPKAEGWQSKFKAWIPWIISHEEVMNALEHENLDTTDFSGGRAPELSVAQRLCRAYAEVAAGIDAGNRSPLKEQYDHGLKADSSFTKRMYCQNTSGPQYVDVRQLDFIDSLTSPIPLQTKTTTPGNYEFAVYWVHENSNVGGWSFGGGFSFFGLMDFKYVHNWMTSFFAGGRNAESETMSVNRTTLSFEARVNHCVMVSGRKDMFKLAPWLFCQPEVSGPVKLNELFQNFTQIFVSNQSTNADAGDETATTKVLIRNKYYSKRVTDLIDDTDLRTKPQFDVFVHSHVPDFAVWDTLQPVDSLTDQDIPGAVNRN